MNTFMQKLGVLTISLSAFLSASAADFEVDGICYNITDSEAKTVEVTSSSQTEYSGDITLPASVTHNGEQYAVTAIGNNAFYVCSGLTSITIPNSVTAIGIDAFYYCSGMTSITIPNSVTTIGIGAFYECRGLTSIDIPNSVTTIESETFIYCSSLTSITIPNSVTTIGSSAFAYCNGLTSITIPNSVTTIGEYAFLWCNGLTSITSFAVTPPACGINAFQDVGTQNCTLYIPAESREAYGSAAEWSAFPRTENIVYVSDIQLNVTEVRIEEGTTSSLFAEVQPEEATNKMLLWESSDAGCVTVDESGMLTARANGTATISVRSYDGKAEATCAVTVGPTTGIEAVEAAADDTVEVFTLTGVKVARTTANLPAGIYLVRRGSTVSKLLVK